MDEPTPHAQRNQALRVLAYETTIFGEVIDGSCNGQTWYEIWTLYRPFHVLVDRRKVAFPYKEFTFYEYGHGKGSEGGRGSRPMFSFVTTQMEHIHSADDHITNEFLQANVFGIEHYDAVTTFANHLTHSDEFVPRHYYDHTHLTNLKRKFSVKIEDRAEQQGYEVFEAAEGTEGAESEQKSYLVYIANHELFVQQKKVLIAEGLMMLCFPTPMYMCLIVQRTSSVQYRGLAFFYTSILTAGGTENV